MTQNGRQLLRLVFPPGTSNDVAFEQLVPGSPGNAATSFLVLNGGLSKAGTVSFQNYSRNVSVRVSLQQLGVGQLQVEVIGTQNGILVSYLLQNFDANPIQYTKGLFDTITAIKIIDNDVAGQTITAGVGTKGLFRPLAIEPYAPTTGYNLAVYSSSTDPDEFYPMQVMGTLENFYSNGKPMIDNLGLYEYQSAPYGRNNSCFVLKEAKTFQQEQGSFYLSEMNSYNADNPNSLTSHTNVLWRHIWVSLGICMIDVNGVIEPVPDDDNVLDNSMILNFYQA